MATSGVHMSSISHPADPFPTPTPGPVIGSGDAQDPQDEIPDTPEFEPAPLLLLAEEEEEMVPLTDVLSAGLPAEADRGTETSG